MRVPVVFLDGTGIVERIETELGQPLRRCARGKKKESLVMTRAQWRLFSEILDEMAKEVNTPMNEAAAILIQAYNRLIRLHGSLTTPPGQAALVSAILSLYVANPGLASRLVYML